MFRIILLAVALGSGAVAAWLVAAMPANETQAAALSPELIRTTEVLVAASDVEQGTQLRPKQMRWQAWIADAVQPAFIVRSERPDAIEELTGSVARGHLVIGGPIVMGNVAPAQSSFLSAVLTPGMRAVAIRVSAEKTAGGFILPNDRVDVLLTTPCRAEDGCQSGMTVRTILKNVRVLAIDQSGSDTSSESVLLGKTATLELDPTQTETIVGAEASGTLSLVLRAAADKAEVVDASEQARRTVRVLRGGVSEYVTIR